MIIKNLKKYTALLGLTSFVLLTGCDKKDEEININIDNSFFDLDTVEEVENSLNSINATYEYEDKYLTDNTISLFIDMDKYEQDCNVILVTDDIDVLAKALVERIETFSKYVSEKYMLQGKIKHYEDYNSPFKYSDKTLSDILYDMIIKMFENEDKENWNELYCKLANTAIVYSEDENYTNNTASTANIDIRDIDLEIPVFGNIININEKNIDELTKKNSKYNANYNYEDIYMYLSYNGIGHELSHCEQNNCPCYYKNNNYFNYLDRLLNYETFDLHTEFLSEAGAVINGNKYYETKEFLKNNNLGTGYGEEIETTKLLESAILLRDDYNVNDIYDNEVSSNPKKICDWFDVDLIKYNGDLYSDDYDKLFNMLTVLNVTNSNNKEEFDYIVEKKYGSLNNMNAKKMGIRSDAVIDLMIYSYKNLIAFNENNNLSYDSFNYLVDKYQNYYISQTRFISEFDGLSYWSNEFRVKFDLSNNIINDYINIKYKNYKEMNIDIHLELKEKLGDKYDVFMTNIGSVNESIKKEYFNSEKSLDDISDVNGKVMKK